MIVSFLAAVDRNLVLGDEKGIPWNLPADLKRFRRLTLGKPLDQRVNIVLSRRPDFRPDGLLVARSMDEAVRLAGDVPELVVIGGGEVFAVALPLVRRMYLTFVAGEFAGTANFPQSVPTPPGFKWTEVHREAYAADEKNPYPHQYVVVERVADPQASGGPFPVRSLMRPS